MYYYTGIFCDMETLVFIMDVCPGHILKSTKGIETELGLKIDVSQGNGSAQEP